MRRNDFNKESKIGRILAEWNPIDVPEYIAYEEYSSYIPMIANCITDENAIEECLYSILRNISSDKEIHKNKDAKLEIQSLTNRILKIMKDEANQHG